MVPTPPEPIANWNPDLDCWMEYDDEMESLFSVPSVVYSGTFPTSGMWVDGTAYRLPTSVPLTDDSECSSLPTPRATRGGSNTETVRLLPTPKSATSGPDFARAERDGSGGDDLETLVARVTQNRPR